MGNRGGYCTVPCDTLKGGVLLISSRYQRALSARESTRHPPLGLRFGVREIFVLQKNEGGVKWANSKGCGAGAILYGT